jgi:hypothetical protein
MILMKKNPLFKHVYPAGRPGRQRILRSLCGSLGLLLAFLSLSSCNQDAIFEHIKFATKLKDAAIPGSLTRIVEFGVPPNNKLYVGSGNVYQYDGASWGSIGNPAGGKVLDLAATTTYLYALIDAGAELSDAQLYRKTADPPEPEAPADWELVYTGRLNSIFGAGDTLFAGEGNTVYYINDSMSDLSVSPAFSDQGSLLGAAKFSSDYFISIQGQGVSHASAGDLESGTPAPQIQYTDGGEDKDSAALGNFKGFIQIAGSLIMVTTNGTLCKIDTATTPNIGANQWPLSFGFNGAIARYTNGTSEYLLLGQSGSNYGYLELTVPSNLDFDTGISLNGPTFTVNNADTYNSSLGTHPVISIYQAPPVAGTPGGPIFATTSLDGLWSCRDGEWNRE